MRGFERMTAAALTAQTAGAVIVFRVEKSRS